MEAATAAIQQQSTLTECDPLTLQRLKHMRRCLGPRKKYTTHFKQHKVRLAAC